MIRLDEKEARKLYKTIAKLEQQALKDKAAYFDLNSELQQALDCCKRVGELEAERDRYREAIIDALPYMEPSDTRFLLEKALEETT